MYRAALITSSATLLFIALATPACRKEDPPPPAMTQATTPPLPSPTPPTQPPAPPSLVSALSMADEVHSNQLIAGFYEKEADWRWTGVAFTVKLAVPPTARDRGGILRLSFTTPKALIAQNPSVTLKARVGDATTSKAFTAAGDHKLELEVPGSVFTSDAVVADFSVAKPFNPGGGDIRALGVIATGVELASK